MNKSSYPRWKELVSKFDRWSKERLPFPAISGPSRRGMLFGTMASIALIGPAEAILFSGAASGGSSGSLNATLTLKTKSGSNIAANQPFEFGFPIAPATMLPTEKLVITDASSNVLTVQEDNRVIDADGYVRWTFPKTILVNAPGAASTSITITKATGATDTSNPITISNLLAQTIGGDTFECQHQITMPNGDVYTALATTGLGASGWTYGQAFFEGYTEQGPLKTTMVVYMPYVKSGTPHAYLYVENHIHCYKASGSAWNNATNPITGVKVYCFNEDGFNGTAAGWTGTPQDYAYDWTIKMGAGTLSTALALTGSAGSGNISIPTAATFTASISGTVLTVTAVSVGNGLLAADGGGNFVKQLLGGAGITAGVYITSFGTGTGGMGTYNLSANLGTVGSQTMTSALYTGNGMDLTRASGSWVTSTTTPNSNDCGKALVELSGAGTGRIYLAQYNSTTNIYGVVPTTTPPSQAVMTSWKTMGVYHYFGSRVSNTNPAIAGSWWGTNHDLVYPILTVAYLKASQMVPNYRHTQATAQAPDLTLVNRDGAHPCGMSINNGQIKNYSNNEAQTGDADHIGVMTLTQVNSLIWWDDATQHANARKNLIYNAEVGHRKPYVLRNEEYGQFNTIADVGIWGDGAGSDAAFLLNQTRTGSNWFEFAGNHSGQTNYMPYLLTGDFYHLQSMKFLSDMYTLQSSGYGINDIGTVNNGVTVSGTTLTGTHASVPFLTGEAFQFQGGRPSVGGVQVSYNNRYFWKSLTSNTGQAYDTRANALAGTSTGRVTFSSGGSGVFLVNGFCKRSCSRAGEGQARQIAWDMRSCGQLIALWPDNPITTGACITYDAIKANVSRVHSNMLVWCANLYVNSANYLAGFKPRFYNISNGTAGGIWQMGYMREMDLQLLEAGVQSPGSSMLQQKLDWSLADAIQWHIETTIWPAAYCSNYYFIVATDFASNPPTVARDFVDCYNDSISVPWNGIAYSFCDPTNLTSSISSIADLANVVVTLSGNYFDTSNKTPYEGKAWLGITSGGNLIGYGKIKTITSASVVVVDFTATTSTFGTVSPISPTTGSGRGIRLPIPPPAVATANAATADYYYDGNNAYRTINFDYSMLDRAAIEIAKQRGINQTNYSSAVAEMTGRHFAFSASNANGAELKFSLVSRI